MLTMADLDGFARDYYLAPAIPDHHIENQMQRDSTPRILAHIPKGAAVLELGYGDGLLTAALQEAGFKADLLEGSSILCQHAQKQHGPALQIHHALFETFTPNRTYDAILALHVLEHLDDPRAILRRIATWLAPGGTLVIVVPNRASIHRRVALRMGLIDALDDLSPRDHLVGHRRVYDLATLENDAAAAGLAVETRFGSFLKTLPNSMMLAFPEPLLTALDAISEELPPDLLANIGITAKKPAP